MIGRSVGIRLNSNEPDVVFECEVDGEGTPCTPGARRYTDASSGRHFFRARSVDKAGTPSAWSQVTEFYVPTDLRRRRGFSRVTKAGAFDETLVKSKKKGARLVLPKQRVGELRLYAPTAPSYGKVRVKVGATNWRVVNLAGPRSAQKEFPVLNRYRGLAHRADHHRGAQPQQAGVPRRDRGPDQRLPGAELRPTRCNRRLPRLTGRCMGRSVQINAGYMLGAVAEQHPETTERPARSEEQTGRTCETSVRPERR
ncbi:hypothetical protein [Nocardioides sp. B-3]|uniref:hypothetical protein n=1 Tax=Nocardioides sp. B-3 TaxID=2895565 RepID=UPI0021535017|nr:hypothetical protein [Nocardioides sp. B-3]UUZ61122.1 hypothetical protein LP418_11090 [Nocardioides sp. B-3]